MKTTENTLTNFQKDYFDFCIETYTNEKNVEPSIEKQTELIDWITKNYEIDFNMVCVFSGKVLTGKAKLNRMFLENMGYMENILDW